MGVVLDTNVLLYAAGGEHPYREPCRRLLEAISRRELAATTTIEVLQEFAYVRAGRRGRVEAGDRVGDVLPSLSPLLPVVADDLTAGLELWQRHEGLGSFDAVLAAAAIRTGATLVSADKAFGRVRGLSHAVPDARGVRRILLA